MIQYFWIDSFPRDIAGFMLLLQRKKQSGSGADLDSLIIVSVVGRFLFASGIPYFSWSRDKNRVEVILYKSSFSEYVGELAGIILYRQSE